MSEFPLLAFTVLTGLSAGAFVADAILAKAAKAKASGWVYPAICVVLLGLGMLGALFHLGHPERFLNALANPSAMIAQEAYWLIPFGILLVADAVLLKLGKNEGVVRILGCVAACGLMVVTALAYFTSYGIPEWPQVPTLLLFFAGDLSLGAAFAVAYRKELGVKPCRFISAALAALLGCTCLAEAAVFAGHGLQMGLFLFGAVAALASAALAISKARERFSEHAGWVAFALVAVSVVVSRFAFYSVV